MNSYSNLGINCQLINVFHIVSQSKTRKMKRTEGSGGKWDAPNGAAPVSGQTGAA